MSAQHTPGPWFHGKWINGDNSEWVDIWTETPDGEKSLPFVACKHFNQEANARLIAAAPDLLEALKWYVETDEVDNSEGNEFWLEGKAKAIAAIAKATGAA